MRLMLLAVAAVATVGSPMGPATAAPPAPPGPSQICKDLVASVTLGEQNLADTFAQGVADDSAPRANLRATQSVAEMQRIAINLELMRDHHCAPLPHAISVGAYLTQAIECRTAIMRGGDKPEPSIAPITHSGMPESCDREMWVRSPTR